MHVPNWSNRTIWTGDNLAVMRGMNSESVDLIYLDPPFNSKRTYSAPIGSKAAGAAFKDTWTLDDVDAAWHGEIAEQNPAVYAVIDAAGIAHGKGRRCCTARSKSLTSLCRLQSHPAQYVSGIPSAAILLSISHPIRCSTRCLANVRARTSGPMIAL